MNDFENATVYDLGDGYTLGLDYRGYNAEGRVKMAYYLRKGERVIFAGDDFSPSPLNSCDGAEAAIDLLGFLTVKLGDVEDDYFADYTPEQKEWTESTDAETLSLLVYDWEDGDGKEEYDEDTMITRLMSTYEGEG